MAREDVAVRPARSNNTLRATARIVPIPGTPTKFVSADVIPKAVYSGIMRRVPTLRGVGDAARVP